MRGASATFKARWVNYVCHPECICGWIGEPSSTLKMAKRRHAEHVRDDCPIGKR